MQIGDYINTDEGTGAEWRFTVSRRAVRFRTVSYSFDFITVKSVTVSPNSAGSMRQKTSLSLGGVGVGVVGGLQRPGPSEIFYKGYRFLITDRPTDATLPSYVEVSRFFWTLNGSDKSVGRASLESCFFEMMSTLFATGN